MPQELKTALADEGPVELGTPRVAGHLADRSCSSETIMSVVDWAVSDRGR